jgi:homoserine/homoserine lactone efflux protein
MMSLEAYLALFAATFVVVIFPGPTVTLTLGNSLRHGTAAGLLTVAGTQIGLATLLTILLIGFASVMELVGHWFEWIRLAGAAYIIWLGINAIRTADEPADIEAPQPKRGGFMLQGILVMLSNAKVLLFFGAFFPQFIDPKGNYIGQLLLAGGTFMVLAALCDGMYALLAGRLREALSAKRVALVHRLSGLIMIGGGVWLALARRS